MRFLEPLYSLYVRRLRAELAGRPIPEHIGIVMDGNRRWARQQGIANPSIGHRYGAQHVEKALRWCEAAGVRHVTVFVCSTENLVKRGDAEVAYLMAVTEEIVAERLKQPDGRWQVHLAGLLDLLPDTTAQSLKKPSMRPRTAPPVTTSPSLSGTAAARRLSRPSAPCW
jgi:short-chain Z-isoprenyl diphosphate synthase